LKPFSLFAALTLSICPLTGDSSASPLPGDKDWDSGFDGATALQHVKVLASDSLRGRYSGFAGADKAERYIAEHFADLNLEEPFGRDGYFHRFNYGAGEYLMPSGLIAHFPDGSTDTAQFWREINIFKYSGFGKVSGRLVFVGYGVSAPEEGWDDYAGIDVKGAIVLAWRGVPQLEGKDFGKWGMSGKKSSFALEQGAVGFLYCENDPPKLATIMEEYYREKLPAAWVSKSFADSLLKGTGKTKDQWKKLADSSGTPVSRVLDVSVQLQVSGKYYPKRKTSNLGGLLLGSDPALRNEVILIGAHMDHHGVDPAGNLYPGADDNASGTATMMELARAFADAKPRLKRSVMFMGFACEEEGLVGSTAFVKEMRMPKGLGIVAMLNMDMVGQGNCSLGVGGIDEFPVLGEAMFKDWPDSAQKPLEFWGLYPGSDHSPFEEAGIPAYVIGARGDHPNYHTPGDSVGNIKPEVMKAVGDMMFHCAAALADYPVSLRSTVGKGEMLINRFGGVRFLNADLAQDGVANCAGMLRWPTESEPVKGVDYHYPLTVIEIDRRPGNDTKQQKSHFDTLTKVGRVPFEWILNLLDNVHDLAEAGKISIIDVDSISSKRNEELRGVVMATRNVTRVPTTGYRESTIGPLIRMGVGFDATTLDLDYLRPHLFETDEAAYDALNAQLRLSSQFTRRCGLRPIFSFGPDSSGSNHNFVQMIVDNHGLWMGQAVCKVDASTTRLDDIKALIKSGVFVYLHSLDALPKVDKEAMIALLKEQLDVRRRTIGIAPSKTFVETLLAANFRESQIGDLLIENFQHTLKEWWASNEYNLQ
jgi:hypothetical protein